MFDRPKPTAGCSANGRRRRRIYIYIHKKQGVVFNDIFFLFITVVETKVYCRIGTKHYVLLTIIIIIIIIIILIIIE